MTAIILGGRQWRRPACNDVEIKSVIDCDRLQLIALGGVPNALADNNSYQPACTRARHQTGTRPAWRLFQ